MESASRIKSRFLVNLGTTFWLHLENIKMILFISSQIIASYNLKIATKKLILF